MRAVNLLPSDLRGSSPSAAPVKPERERVEGIGAYVVLGALALCVAMLAVYVVASNNVKQKQADLDTVTAQADAAAQAAAKLKPYADFEASAKARVETVRGIAAARFDWERALRDLSRAMPADVKLESLTGDMGIPGASGAGGDSLRGSIASPAISLAGCTTSQPAVARMMARLRAIDGVTRVSLSRSEKGTSSTGSESACEGKNPPVFSAVVFFEGAKALENIAPAQTDAATQASVPVPNSVAGSAPSGSTPADAGNSAAAASTDGTSTTTDGGTTP
jgi:Tfp pilus assembly protein PilN